MSTAPAPAAPARRLLDVREVARLPGCSPRTVVRLADAGLAPPGVKLGGLRRRDAAELDALIAGGCRPPCAPADKR